MLMFLTPQVTAWTTWPGACSMASCPLTRSTSPKSSSSMQAPMVRPEPSPARFQYPPANLGWALVQA
jgi:hypothetical protein